MKLWCRIEEIHVIVLKEVSFEWNVIIVYAKNKHKIEKIWFGIEVLFVLFHQRVFFQWNFILISAKNKHKIEKILIWNRSVLCHISQGGIVWLEIHTNFSQKWAQNLKILIWNWGVMCHTFQGGIFWIKFHTQFQQKLAKIYEIVILNWRVTSLISQGSIIWVKFHTQFQPTLSKNWWNYDFEEKCYVSYFSRRYHLNEISYSISTKNKQKLINLWFWIEELQVIFLKEESFD